MSTDEQTQPATRYHQMRPHMEAAYPAVFTPRKTPPVPLALGVGVQLMAELTEMFGERSAKIFMAGWTCRREYRWAILTGTQRYALDGSVAGGISDKDRDHARDQLVDFYAAQFAKRKTHTDEIGDPAKRFPELGAHEEVRLLVIEATRARIAARPVRRKRKKRVRADA